MCMIFSQIHKIQKQDYNLSTEMEYKGYKAKQTRTKEDKDRGMGHWTPLPRIEKIAEVIS